MSAETWVQPENFSRRSFIYRTLVQAGARFVEIKGAAVAEDFGAPEKEAQTARRLGLLDLSPLPRTGFKGPGTVEWLSAQDVHVPGESNCAVRQAHGALALRLAPNEVMILGDLAGQDVLPAKLNEAWDKEAGPPSTPRGFPLPRDETHAWFLVTGMQAPAMFAKLCAVDLRLHSFADGAIAQTSLAKMTATLVRDDKGRVPAFHILADSASATYLWDCLIDAMADFEGGPVGLGAVREF